MEQSDPKPTTVTRGEIRNLYNEIAVRDAEITDLQATSTKQVQRIRDLEMGMSALKVALALAEEE